MTIVSPKPRLSEIIAEFGSDGTPTFSDYLRGGGMLPYPGNPHLAAISKTRAGLRLSQFAGATREVVLTLSGNCHMVNLKDLYTSTYGAAPTEAVLIRLIIASDAHIYSSSPATPAINVGALPFNSKVVIENRGVITGARGAPNSGAAGDTIWSIDNVVTDLINTGLIRPGGGAGGIGGQGGSGYWVNSYNTAQGMGHGVAIWTSCDYSCSSMFGGNSFCNGYCDIQSSYFQCHYCAYATYYNVYTTGGAGGSGGFGFGCYDAAGNVADPTAGISGAAPGTNAGWGGAGGTGGASGANGNNGNNGAAGNNSGGAVGGTGGSAGRFVRHSMGKFTLVSNTGTINGSTLEV